jgi:purine-binding chemotaxis protein CheW
MSGSSESALHLLCRVGSTQLAFPAEQIEAVVRVEGVVPAPGAPPSVRGLAAIRSRLLTLIDCAVVAGVSGGDAPLMAIITVDGHGYGLLLDAADDVVELPPSQSLPAKVDRGWLALQPRMVDVQGQILLLIEPAQFIAQAAQFLVRAA